jgi:hypothetical protein
MRCSRFNVVDRKWTLTIRVDLADVVVDRIGLGDAPRGVRVRDGGAAAQHQ